jgi:hypothetical protein
LFSGGRLGPTRHHLCGDDKRILIHRSTPFAKFTVLTFDQLPSVNLIERSAGRGTIRFGQDQPAWANHGYSGWSPAFDPTPQFIAY